MEQDLQMIKEEELINGISEFLQIVDSKVGIFCDATVGFDLNVERLVKTQKKQLKF